MRHMSYIALLLTLISAHRAEAKPARRTHTARPAYCAVLTPVGCCTVVRLTPVPAGAPVGNPCEIPGCPCGCTSGGVCDCYADRACTVPFRNSQVRGTPVPMAGDGTVYLPPPAGMPRPSMTYAVGYAPVRYANARALGTGCRCGPGCRCEAGGCRCCRPAR